MKTAKGRGEGAPHLIESSNFTHAAHVTKNTQRLTARNAINRGVMREDDLFGLDS